MAHILNGCTMDEDPEDSGVCFSRPPSHMRTSYTWGDVTFVSEIADGIGTGSRRARQERLNKFIEDEEKKKKLIHLICRVKGEKVYDEKKEAKSNMEIKINDVDMLIEQVLGKMRVKNVI